MSEPAPGESVADAATGYALEALADEAHPKVTILWSPASPSYTQARLVADGLHENGIEASLLPIATAAWALLRQEDGTDRGLVIDATCGDPLPAAQYAALSGQQLLVLPHGTSPADDAQPALFLGRDLAGAAVVVQDIGVHQVSIEMTGVRPVAVRSRHLSDTSATDLHDAGVTQLLMPRGATLRLRCDRDLVRADLTSASNTYSWWTHELVVEATEGDQVLTFDDSVHLGMTGPLVIGRLDQLPRRALRVSA